MPKARWAPKCRRSRSVSTSAAMPSSQPPSLPPVGRPTSSQVCSNSSTADQCCNGPRRRSDSSSRSSVELADLGQEFAARGGKPLLVLLQAGEDRHIALVEELAAQLVGARFARDITAPAQLILWLLLLSKSRNDGSGHDDQSDGRQERQTHY